MGSYPLLVLENPLLDIQGRGDEALLKKYDLKANDAILADETKHASLYDDLMENCGAKLIAGGSAQNSARGAQYILPENSVVYLGSVGKDTYSDKLKEEAEKAGIRTEYRYDDEIPTGRCGVVITGQNRSLCTELGAANKYELKDLKEKWSFVEHAEVFFVGGYHITVCVPAIKALAHEAAEKNKIFFFSLSAPFIPEFFKEPVDEVLEYCDYVIGNETEAAAYAKAHDLGDISVEKIAAHIAQLPKKNHARPRVVIITQGTDPTIVAVSEEKESKDVKTKSYPVRKISQDKIEDTNGAGDAFAGGFLAGLVEGKDLDTCVDMGQWLAALSITQLGASYPYPKQLYSKA